MSRPEGNEWVIYPDFGKGNRYFNSPKALGLPRVFKEPQEGQNDGWDERGRRVANKGKGKWNYVRDLIHILSDLNVITKS